MPDVYIAEGHGRRPDGTFDPGATDGIHTEQRDSKPVAEACTAVLRNAGLDVISESEMADDPNFYGTTDAANEADVKCVVSFHYDWNQAPPGAFAIATTDDGRELGWAIENRVAEAGFDTRDYPDDRDGLYLLDNSHAPAVIFECGRIGHEDIDETDEQRAMGEAAALGILDWLGADMVDRKTAVDPNPALTDNVQRMVDAGVFSEHTQPGGVTFNDELATFLERAGVLDIKRALDSGRLSEGKTWTKKQITALIAGSAAGGATAAEVIQEIVTRLAG